MAKDNSIGNLYMKLGLNLSELETDFIAAEKTTRENVARLNRESNLIKLRTEVEIGNLDPVADSVEILAVQEKALNEQLAIQRDKIKIAEANLASLTKQHGSSAAITQKAAANLERERLVLQRLGRELQSVNQSQARLNQTTQSAKGNMLLNGYDKLKGFAAESLGGITTAFQKIPGAANLADGAITKVIGTIGKIPTPVGIAVTAIIALPAAVKIIEDSLVNLAKPAISAGDSFYVMSRGLQMSIEDTEKLSIICKVTGIEINEVIGTTRRLSNQLVKSNGTDTLSKTLKQYGVEVRNANGELKNAYDMSVALAGGLQKAREAGKAKEFLASTLGRNASGDFVTYLEDLAGNIEQAKKVVKNGLFDPVRAHAIQGELNTLEAQSEQLKSAFSASFMPIAEKIVPHTTERLGELTKVIADNSDKIKTFGLIIAEIIGGIETVATTATVKIIELGGSLGNLLTAKSEAKNQLIETYLKDAEVNSVENLMIKAMGENLERVKENPELYQQTLNYYRPIFEALVEAREKIEKEVNQIQDILNQSISRADFHILKGFSAITDEELEGLRKVREQTNALSDELYKLTHEDFENKTLDVNRWQEKLLNDENTTAEQREIIAQITAEKLTKIEKEKNEKIQKETEKQQQKIQDLTQSTAQLEYGLTHSAFEKQLYDIELWKDAQLEKSKTAEETAAIIANAAAKEADAFQREMDRIQGRIESAQDKLFRLTHSQQEYDLRQAQKEYDQYIKDGVPKELARQVYEATVADIERRAREDKLLSNIFGKTPINRFV